MKRILKSILCGAVLGSVLVSAPAAAWAQNADTGYFEQGNALYNQKKYAEAVASYVRAIQAAPQSAPKAYLNCARAYSMQKKYAEAAAYYGFYARVEPAAENDRKFKAEYKTAQRKSRNSSYVRDQAQTAIYDQVRKALAEGGPILTRQGNGVFAYYQVLLRSGFAEPDLFDIQKKIVVGLEYEILRDVTPPQGQPLPNLDRMGWEFIRDKIAKLRSFSDVKVDMQKIEIVETTALAWEAYYRGDYSEAETKFDAACSSAVKLPAAFWGRVQLSFQLEKNDVILTQIDDAEHAYVDAKVDGVTPFFALLRAQVYRNLGDSAKSLDWLDIMQRAF